MQFCTDHWDELRQAIDAEGLGHLASANPEVAAVRTLSEMDIAGEKDPAMFDPHMYAMWALIVNGTLIIGQPLVLVEGCPICELLEHHERTCDGDPRCRTVEEVESWISKSAASAREHYETLKE